MNNALSLGCFVPRNDTKQSATNKQERYVISPIANNTLCAIRLGILYLYTIITIYFCTTNIRLFFLFAKFFILWVEKSPIFAVITYYRHYGYTTCIYSAWSSLSGLSDSILTEVKIWKIKDTKQNFT